METAGISEAIQILNVIINGASTALKLTGQFAHFSGHQMKELGKFVLARAEEIKNRPETLSLGESHINEVFRICQQNDEALGCMVISPDSLDKFVAFANENQLSFAKMKALEGQKGDITIIYPEGQKWAYQSFMMQNENARASTLSEYIGSVSEQDRVDVDSLLDRIHAYETILGGQNQNAPIAVPIDKSQFVCNENTVEVTMNMNGEMGFVKLPISSLSIDHETNEYILKLSDSHNGFWSKKPSITKDKDGKLVENLVEGSPIRGVDIRNGITKRYQDITKGKSATKTFSNPDANISKTVDFGKKAGDTAADIGKSLGKTR